ncbi:LuxR C-terminal-related transcriptional regulator [Pseudomonas sp. NPDC089534]
MADRIPFNGRLMPDGCPHKDIARKLSIAVKTVQAHKNTVLQAQNA